MAGGGGPWQLIRQAAHEGEASVRDTKAMRSISASTRGCAARVRHSGALVAGLMASLGEVFATITWAMSMTLAPAPDGQRSSAGPRVRAQPFTQESRSASRRYLR